MSTNIDQFVPAEIKAKYEHSRVAIPGFLRSPRKLMSVMLVFADALSFILAGLFANTVRAIFIGEFSAALFIEILPFIILGQVVYALRHLYPGIGIGPVNELRRLTNSTTAIFLLLAAMTFWFRNPENFSRLNLALTWIFAIALVPIGRALMREICGRFEYIGEPIVVIGFGERGKDMVDNLHDNKGLGLRPVLIIDGWDDTGGRYYGGVPIVHLDDPKKISSLSKELSVDTAIILASEIPYGVLEAAEKISQDAFKNLILIPDREQIGGSGIRRFDLGMSYGLEVKRNLLNSTEMLIKRITDIFLVLSGGLLISPIIILISIMIKLDSNGPVFYGHTRVGLGGRKFKAWKFRTMVPNANQVLNEYLESNPGMQSEWDKTYKLQNDPRVTRVGKVLRKLSVDELPQLWNVFMGEMSLVGPRPIVKDEIGYYGDSYDLYSFVLPGITGLWQVSGRSDTSYEGRVCLDEYYVRNWSIWMDIYILARTVSVVLKRQGAY